MESDFIVGGGGSIYTLLPVTEAAKDWLDENVAAEPWQFMGGALAVEHRYIDDLLDGIALDGLTVLAN